ncbi:MULTISPECIES: DNA-directed RNA polymerase subunit omega [Caloramator]|uniref:DNA-directed RNA polymerase subunit omega n=1 Tax=Caloramator proteoclasticus DSM 10124 TaxID=1121262 RepID=A0A1M5AN03_9CLOT|nr:MULTISPECIES: DNA-directed RNA polymerase subunit omega [Caloramator]MCX7695561.1 DNA-directed RNA polymerase subunit omega [Caloramator sp.]SHF31650.1 DNA-directed RNA polymerase subunit omega [Caloramator proteoclasticus DSM 10124]
MTNNTNMINPSIVSLLQKVSDRYSLVVVTARRARQLIDKAEPLVKVNSNKPVTIAINEINEGKIKYESLKSGIK